MYIYFLPQVTTRQNPVLLRSTMCGITGFKHKSLKKETSAVRELKAVEKVLFQMEGPGLARTSELPEPRYRSENRKNQLYRAV